ncbi:MAG: CoA ester lyase [Magnetococcales bacterium]|nr:CoA ester lyase [Magnetococcales bacterium]
MQNSASRLLRSILYVPASKEKVLKKAPNLGSDGLILDLEDSVPIQLKSEARLLAKESLRQVDSNNVLRTVRINGLNTGFWVDDVEAVFSSEPDAIVVPKVDSLAALQPLFDLLSTLESVNSGRFTPAVWAMIESPLGVLNSYSIAAHPRIGALMLGTSDLGAALGVAATVDRSNMSSALQQTVLSAKAAGVFVLDGVFVDLKDPQGFITQCRDGAGLGFDGKTVIHPSQIDSANRLFLPSEAQVAKARKILSLWQQANISGEEICVVDGVLVERLHARRSLKILKSVNEMLDIADL